MTESREIKRVVAYLRISRDRENQTSIQTQEDEIRRVCDINKWEVVEVLGDAGRSAFKGVKRPEFEQAISMIQNRQADAIVVFKLDRFTRSVVEFWKCWEIIKRSGGHFVSCTEQLDTSNNYAEMMLGLIAGMAQMESQMKRDRAIPMHRKQKELGKVGPGPRPYGYSKIDSKDNDGKGAILTPIPKEADLLKLAAEWVIGGKSLQGFVSTYQPESSMANKQMTYRGLKCALINPTTAGLRTYDGSPDGYSVGRWEPIIDRATWDQLRGILMDADRRTTTTNQISHLLSGLMVCPKCSKNVTARNWVHPKSRAITKRYMCPVCLTSVDMASIDALAIEALFEAVPESKWDAWQTSGLGWDTETVKAIEDRLGAVDRMFSDGKLNENRWVTMTADLTEQLEACQNNEPLDIPIVANLRASWEAMTLADQQRVFRQAFEAINILPQRGSRNPRTRIELIER